MSHQAFLLLCVPRLLKQDCIALTWSAYPLKRQDAEGRQRVNHVTVFERPSLHEFLQRTSEFADLILFTVGLEGYAKPLVDRIDAYNRFMHRLYRPSTVTTV